MALKILFFIFTIYFSLYATKIELTNGKIFEGTIVSENETYLTLRIESTIITILKELIVKIDNGKSVELKSIVGANQDSTTGKTLTTTGQTPDSSSKDSALGVNTPTDTQNVGITRDTLPAIDKNSLQDTASQQVMSPVNKTDTSVVDTSTSKREPPPALSDLRKIERKKNRSGLKICLNISPSPPEHHFTYQDTTISSNPHDTLIYNGTLKLDTLFDSHESRVFINPQIMAIIKAGRILTLNIGGGYCYGYERFFSSHNYNGLEFTQDLQYQYNIFSFLNGVNLVFRMFPVKLNVGFSLDINVPVTISIGTNLNKHSDHIPFSLKDTIYLPELNYRRWLKPNVRFTPGIRAGFEILAWPLLGIGIETTFKYLTFKYDQSTEYGYTTRIIDHGYDKVLFPLFGVGISLNFYKYK